MREYSNEQKEAVREAVLSEQDLAVYKRLQIILQRMNGGSIAGVAEQNLVCESTVKNICKLFMEYGIEGLKFKYKGRIGKLSFEREAEVLTKLADKASSGQYLHIADLQADFEVEAGVSYEHSAFHKLLNRHDWRKIMPRKRHPKGADEATCEAAKKLTIF